MNESTPNYTPSSLQVPDPKLETFRLKLIELAGQAVAENGPMVGHWGMADGSAFMTFDLFPSCPCFVDAGVADETSQK